MTVGAATGLLPPVAAVADSVDRIGPGIAVGVVGAVVTVVLARVARRTGRADLPAPVAGVVLVATALVALHRAGQVPERLVPALGALVIGPTLVAALTARRGPDTRTAAGLGALAALPGAVLLADCTVAAAPMPGGRLLVVVSVVVGGAAVVATDRAGARAGLGPVLLAAACGAAFTTLPDTEQIGAVAGAALPFALVGFPVAAARLGPGGYAATGLLAWSAVVGGFGRPGATVGSLAGLGVLLVLPVALRRWRGRERMPERPLAWRTLALLGIQAVTSTLTARVAGLRPDLLGAAVVALPVLALTLLGTVAVLAPTRSAGTGGPRSRTMSSDEPTR